MHLPPCDQLPSADDFWNTTFPDFGDIWRDQADPDVKAVIAAARQPISCIPRWWENEPRRAVVATIMWGYPTVMRGRMETSMKQASTVGKVVTALKAESLSAATLVAVLCGFPNVGPSTATKLLFTAGANALEGACLIYDQRVVRSIAKVKDEEFSALRGKASAALGARRVESALNGMQRRTYAEYLKAVHASAGRLDCDPLRLEQFLFQRGGNQPPRRRCMVPNSGEQVG